MALTDLDRNLIRRCLDHEASAWKEFVDRYAGLVLHVIHHTAHARSVKLTPEDVDDLCSDVFLEILHSNYAVLRHFRGNASLATYLTVVSRRVIVRELIHRRMSEALGHVKAHQEAVEQSGAETGRIENRELVEQLLEGLPETEATAVRMFHLDGKTYREISQVLKIPENSLGPLLSRVREKLRRVGSAAS